MQDTLLHSRCLRAGRMCHICLALLQLLFGKEQSQCVYSFLPSVCLPFQWKLTVKTGYSRSSLLFAFPWVFLNHFLIFLSPLSCFSRSWCLIYCLSISSSSATFSINWSSRRISLYLESWSVEPLSTLSLFWQLSFQFWDDSVLKLVCPCLADM